MNLLANAPQHQVLIEKAYSHLFGLYKVGGVSYNMPVIEQDGVVEHRAFLSSNLLSIAQITPKNSSNMLLKIISCSYLNYFGFPSVSLFKIIPGLTASCGGLFKGKEIVMDKLISTSSGEKNTSPALSALVQQP